MLPEKIIFIAILLNLVGHVLYIKSIIKGDTKPNLVSWIIWMLAPFIGVFFQIKAGAGLSAVPVFMAGFGPFIIIISALLVKNAFWKIHKLDIYCGILSISSLVLYIATRNLSLSIIFAILADALAFIPTYIKAWNHPETESHNAYSWAILSNLIGLLIIKEWSFPIFSFGLYLVIGNIGMLYVLFRKKIFKTV